MEKAHLIWGFHWILYCFVHSLLANETIKELFSTYLKLSRKTYRIMYNVLALGYLVVLMFYHFELQSPMLFQTTIISDTIALLLLASGVLIMLACILKYFKQMSGISRDGEHQPLHTNGLHHFVRHPLYLGTFLFLIGLTVYRPYEKNLLVTGIIIVYTMIGILLEEKKLLKIYGNDYKRYQHTVPMIIPGLRVNKNK